MTAWTRGVIAQLGLTINEAQTSVKNARVERFDFVMPEACVPHDGYSFGPHWSPKQRRWKNGPVYQGASPSKKSIGRMKDKVSDILVVGNPGTWDEVSDRLNASLRGWSGYFAYGSRAEACRAVNHHVAEPVRVFLTRRHKVRRHGYDVFPDRRIYGELGVLNLRRKGTSSQPWTLP